MPATVAALVLWATVTAARADDDAARQLGQAFAAYDAGDLAGARAALTGLTADRLANPDYLLWPRGQIALLDGHPADAAVDFAALAATPDSRFARAAAWRAADAAWEQGQRADAAASYQRLRAAADADLFENLQASNRELQDAYQATLEGWVQALDMRDKETEGHTQRVSIFTERLARAMGVEGDALINIIRRALLHDIGKMAIPDGILLKPDKLTDEERALIQKHPQYAYDMLKRIDFLLPVIYIPYCHHEKWDGTGYPRGLKGEMIPFAARIFTVIDVWDGLISDRPYRKALPHPEVRVYIVAESGIQSTSKKYILKRFYDGS